MSHWAKQKVSNWKRGPPNQELWHFKRLGWGKNEFWSKKTVFLLNYSCLNTLTLSKHRHLTSFSLIFINCNMNLGKLRSFDIIRLKIKYIFNNVAAHNMKKKKTLLEFIDSSLHNKNEYLSLFLKFYKRKCNILIHL